MGTAAEVVLAPAECQRLLEDRLFRRRFEAAYRGSADPADALWWLAHPEERGPSGADTPRRDLLELRRRVYRPDAVPGAVLELERTLARIDRERQQALSALRLAVPPVPPPPASPPEAVPDVPAARVGPTLMASLRRLPRRFMLTAAAAVLVGIGGGAVLGVAPLLAVSDAPAPLARLLVGAEAPAPVPPEFTAQVSVRVAHTVLDRRPRPSDAPFALMGPQFQPSTFRRLATYPAERGTIYVARDRLGDVCLVEADVFYRASCVDPASWRRDGILLVWTSGASWPQKSTLTHVAAWRSDGRLAVGPEVR